VSFLRLVANWVRRFWRALLFDTKNAAKPSHEKRSMWDGGGLPVETEEELVPYSNGDEEEGYGEEAAMPDESSSSLVCSAVTHFIQDELSKMAPPSITVESTPAENPSSFVFPAGAQVVHDEVMVPALDLNSVEYAKLELQVLGAMMGATGASPLTIRATGARDAALDRHHKFIQDLASKKCSDRSVARLGSTTCLQRNSGSYCPSCKAKEFLDLEKLKRVRGNYKYGNWEDLKEEAPEEEPDRFDGVGGD
jgi:hypothetical protein